MEYLVQAIKKAVHDLYGINPEIAITVAPEGTGADFATNVAMQLAKLVHKSPMLIAEDIKAALVASSLNFDIQVAAPGFLNFISPDEYFIEKIAKIAQNPNFFKENISQDEYDGQVVVTEFSDPNPFKVLHVGHFYTSVVGDSISRLLELAGAKVVRVNFGGDVGLHVGKTIWQLERSGASVDNLTIEQIADAYVAGTAAYEEDASAKAEITALNKEIYRINLEDLHDSDTAKLYWRGRELSYEYFQKFYHEIGVKFDKYYPESSVAERGLAEVKNHLGAVYEESDGAVVYHGEKLGLHTRVFINREGVPTYEAKDVGLIFTKFDDYAFCESVVVTGNEQTEYMKVVLASVAEYAPRLVERTAHLTHGLVKLPGNVKMSSRKGNFLRAVDVLDMIREMLGGDQADPKIVLAAIKYAFLKYKMGGDIIFDPSESVATTGNSGVYLLYSVVRAHKILQNITNQPAKYQNFATSSERRLAKKLAEYTGVLNLAIADKSPNKVCTYLYELAQEFSRFYENVQVAGSDREAELSQLVLAYYNVMQHGLGLLGIEIPEEM